MDIQLNNKLEEHHYQTINNIFQRKSNISKYGRGSGSFEFNDGTRQEIHTYEGRRKAIERYLDDNGISLDGRDLDILYNNVSSNLYSNSDKKLRNKGERIDKVFNEISKDKGLEGKLEFDAMSKEGKLLKASQNYNSAKEVVPNDTIIDKGVKRLRGTGAVAIVGLMYLGLGILAPTLGYAKAPKVNSNPTPVVETLDMNDEKFIAPTQNLGLEDMVKKNIVNYNHKLNSGEVLNKRWNEVFQGLGEITPYEATNLSLIYAKELAKKGVNININKLPVGYEVQGEVILGNEAVQDFIMYKADLLRTDKTDSKSFDFGHYKLGNVDKNTTKHNVEKSKSKLIYDGNLQLRNISGFKSFGEFESYFNTLSLNFPSGTNFWLVGKQTLKGLGLPYNAKMLKYFQKAIEEKKKVDLNKVKAGSSTSLNGVLSQPGFGDIVYGYF